MRVLYPVIEGSGIEIYTARLAAGLAPMGWKGELRRFSPAWEYFPWALTWAWKCVATPARESKLVHVNADYGVYFSIHGKPLVATLHHSSIDAPYLSSLPLPIRWHHQLVLKPSVGKVLRRASALVAVSQHTRDTICDLFQRDLRIQVIHNGIDAERFQPTFVAPDSLPGVEVSTESKRTRPIVLFFSGNPSHRKGADLFAPVMRQLGSDYELRATGGLRGASPSFFDAPNIRCLGRLNEGALIQELNRADIVLQPSRREGFGLSILEAMACAKPVVSSNVSAIPELLKHEKGGYLCEPGSVDQIVNAIRRLAQSEALRNRMGKFNRQVVEERFTLSRMAQAYHQLYGRLI